MHLKPLLMLTLLLACQSVFGKDLSSPLPMDRYQAGMMILGGNLRDCISSEIIPLKISRKIDPRHYDLEFDSSSDPVHILLKTKNANFRNPGHPMGIGVRSGKPGTLINRDGFERKVETIEECMILPLPRHFSETERSSLPYWSVRDEIRGK